MEAPLRDMAPTDGPRWPAGPGIGGANQRAEQQQSTDERWEMFPTPRSGSTVIEGKLVEGAAVGRNPQTEELWFVSGASGGWRAPADAGDGFAIYEHEFTPGPPV